MNEQKIIKQANMSYNQKATTRILPDIRCNILQRQSQQSKTIIYLQHITIYYIHKKYTQSITTSEDTRRNFGGGRETIFEIFNVFGQGRGKFCSSYQKKQVFKATQPRQNNQKIVQEVMLITQNLLFLGPFPPFLHRRLPNFFFWGGGPEILALFLEKQETKFAVVLHVNLHLRQTANEVLQPHPTTKKPTKKIAMEAIFSILYFLFIGPPFLRAPLSLWVQMQLLQTYDKNTPTQKTTYA
eukprot:TRINITY_DN17695_c0_g2_i2.p5 TRINITY_DN17695_c0_g2~~TRINITY_DN17695_c0_g2_i2.p5  ORF type:complete len:241 (+),score=10.89 TRINITY_DN17695_c0_g2_i2:3833-4555(+)